MPTFNPQFTEVKETGRIELAKAAGLSLKAAAPYFTGATHKNFQAQFNQFVTAFPESAKHISDNRPDGVGPGEMVAWFVFDNVTLGGKNSSLDINVDGQPFAEMKGGYHTLKTNTIDNFKITKDGDPAVCMIMQDLKQFNATFKAIRGQDLTGWSDGVVTGTALNLWKAIDLKKLAQQTKGPPKERVYLPIDPNGDVMNLDGERTTHLEAADALKKIKEIVQAERKIPVDNKTSTLEKIIERWKDQVFIDYLEGKRIALINTKTMQMMFFGHLAKEMLGLYRVHRNQPWARIYLDLQGSTE